MDFFTKRWRYLARRISSLFKMYHADETVAAGFRAQQIKAILRLTPLNMMANVINAIIILSMYNHHSNFATVVVWTLVLLVSVVWSSRAWFRERLRARPERVSRRALKRANQHALALGVIWAILPVLVFSSTDPTNSLVLIAICLGMICAGGFSLAAVPQAATSYVLALSLGCEIAIMTDNIAFYWKLALLILLYAFIICSAVLASAKTFGARLMAEAEASHQQQLISLLLHDFESNTSDWLWEIDNRGVLQHPSKKLLKLLGKDSSHTHQLVLTELFDEAFYNQQLELTNTVTQLRKLLTQSEPFRELTLPIIVNGERHWWQLTAKPLLNNQSQQVGWRGVGSDVTEKRNAEIEMRRLANYDSLTGIANRHYFYQQLKALQNQAVFSPLAVFFLDLDNFKNVNDSLGHGIGDHVLKTVSDRLQKNIRANDLLARLGGDEFAIISVGDESATRAAQLAQRILDTFLSPCTVDGKNLQIGCSIGIALAPEHGNNPDNLLKNADMALYAAKSAGRNTFRFYEAGMEVVAQQKLHLMNDMRSALEEHEATAKLLNKNVTPDFFWPTTPIAGQFEIYFQPQITLSTHELIGFEALIRWHHPELGLISPAQFIPLAEESNLIVPIGTWVIVEACKYAAKWQTNWRIAVNLSAVQFRLGNVVELVQWALSISRLAPERLELEITESLLIHDNIAAQQTLTALRRLGVRIALDDFGTGYSSLAYLRSFPLNKLKIDRSFVNALTKDTSALAIVNAIIQLAEALMLETTAEGIESELEADILRACGCSDAQGFYFGAPMPLPDAIAFAEKVERITSEKNAK